MFDRGNLLGPELLHVLQLIQGFTLRGSVCSGYLREPGLLSPLAITVTSRQISVISSSSSVSRLA